MTPDELAAIRERDATLDDVALYASQEGRDRRALLAHIDALEKAVEGLDVTDDATWPIVSRASLDRLLALLRGTPQR